MTRSVVVAGGPLRELAAQWAAAGLVGECLWVDPAEFSPEALASRNPAATLLPQGETGTLTDLLEADADTRVRVIWCRTRGVGPEAEAAIAGMDALYSALPGLVTGSELVDLLGPQQAGLDPWPVTSPLWRTLVVGTRDALAPGRASDLHLEDPTLLHLHAACVLGGILGGRQRSALPGWGAGGALRTQAIDVFSSVLGGGEAVTGRVRSFIDQELPLASGVDVRPDLHTHELADRLVDDAFAHLRRSGLGASLSYVEPPPASFASREIVSAGEHVGRIRDMVEFLFLKSKPVSFKATLTNGLAKLLQEVDLGYDLEQVPDSTVDITNYYARDAELVSWLGAWWTWQTDTRREGDAPDPSVWGDVVKFTTGLVDGGPLPEAFGRHPKRHDRIVVAPRELIHFDPMPNVATRSATGGVQHHPVAEEIAADAAQKVLVRATAAPLIGQENTGSHVTRRLAERAAEVSEQAREEQADRLRPDAQAADSLPLLERLRSAVLADRIASALDADRLYRTSVSELGQITPLRAARFWFLFGTGALVSGGLLTGFGLNQVAVLDWLASLGMTLSPEAAWSILSVVTVALVVGPVLWFYTHLQQYMERGRRQLEARTLLFRGALLSWREHLRLQQADRLLARWCDVLVGILPSHDVDEPATPSFDLALPRGLQLGEPVYTEPQLRRWLVAEAAPVGWRHRALTEMAAQHLEITAVPHEPDDVLGALCRDTGLEGGPLETLALAGPARWAAWSTRRCQAVDAGLRSVVERHAETVATAAGQVTVAEFWDRLSRPTYVAAASYGRPVQPEASLAEVFEATPVSASLCPDVLHVRSVVYHRTLDVTPIAVPPSLVPGALDEPGA